MYMAYSSTYLIIAKYTLACCTATLYALQYPGTSLWSIPFTSHHSNTRVEVSRLFNACFIDERERVVEIFSLGGGMRRQEQVIVSHTERCRTDAKQVECSLASFVEAATNHGQFIQDKVLICNLSSLLDELAQNVSLDGSIWKAYTQLEIRR